MLLDLLLLAERVTNITIMYFFTLSAHTTIYINEGDCYCYPATGLTISHSDKVTSGNCTTPCPGNPLQRCGGDDFLSGYITSRNG